MAENIIDTLAQSDKLDNPALKQKRDAMRGNTELYDVQSGDTIAKIARDHGIADYSDLLALNRLMGNDLKSKGKTGTNIIIKEWDPNRNKGDRIFIPKDMNKFRADIENIKKITEAMVMNEKVAKGDTKALQKEIHERIFPKFRQSLGMHRLNDGLIGNMQASLHLGWPRQVDPKFQTGASCAHYYRQELRSAFNIGDMPSEWKKFMNTGNIDAWELPERLLKLTDNGKNEFIQKANFMDFFDTSKFGTKTSPLSVGKDVEYARKMIELNEYLMNTPNATNSAMPVYYRYSNYQLHGIDQARVGGEKHYNTHMMRYIGSGSVPFPAYEWGEVHSDGTITPFGGDKKRLEKETLKLKWMLAGEKSIYENRKKALLEYTKNEFPKHTFTIDKRLTEYSKGGKTEEARAVIRKELEALFESGNIEHICTRLSEIIHWPVKPEDAKLLIHWQKNKQNVTKGLKRIEEILESKKPEEFPYFSPDDYSDLLLGSKKLSGVLIAYNDAVKRVNSLEGQITSVKGKIEDAKIEEKNQEKIQKDAREQISKLTPELQKAKIEHEKIKQVFLASLDEWKNSELKTWFNGFDAVAKKHFWSNGGSRSDALIQGFQSGKFGDDFRVQMRMTPDDFNYLKALFLNREKIRKNITSIQARLGASSNMLPEIHIDDMEKIFGKNNQLVASLSSYNTSVAKVNGYTNDISTNEEKMKIKKEISVVDYLLNFMQQRADYGMSAIMQEGRKQLLEGLTMYAGTVKLKVNGKAINIAEELKKGARVQSKISPEDIIEISGPVMSDGFHIRTLKDPVEREKIQGRQRYLFELLATQTFFPSEVIEPTPGSLMHRNTFREATDSVKTKGNYSLDSGDTLEHIIKRLVPIYERAEFEKLDPTAPNYQKEYQKLLQKHYALQIKGLQMLGYMQSEDSLNLGAIKINQAIPYFDSTNLSKQFSSYIAGIKTKRKENVAEMAKYREFINIQTLPGDTVGIFCARIIGYTQEHANHFAKYPNLAYVSGMNDFLKKEFFQELLKTSITSAKDTQIMEMFQEGKVRSGHNFVFRLEDIDRIIGKLKNVSYTPSTEAILWRVDRDVIRMTVPMEQNRNIIRSTMFVESYEYDNGQSSFKKGISRVAKSTLEAMPILQNLKNINSYGDFQVRWLKDLRHGFGEEYITQKQLVDAFNILSRWDVQAYLATVPSENREVVQKDIAIIEKAKIILSQKTHSPEDFEMLSKYLLSLVRLDNGSNSNVVGKFIGASLINEKMNGHFQKLNGVLRAVNEPVEGFRGNAEQMGRYEDAVYLTNNLGEKFTVLGFAENYLYRIIEGTKIIEKTGERLQYANLYRTGGRGLEYGTRTFLEHVKFITDQVEKSEKYLGGASSEMLVTGMIHHFGTNVQEIALNMAKERLILNEKIRTATDPKESTRLKKEWNDSFSREDALILKEIYVLLSDGEFRKTVQWFNIDTSFLPTKQEMVASDSFRYQFFNHVRKGEKFENITALNAEKTHG